MHSHQQKPLGYVVDKSLLSLNLETGKGDTEQGAARWLKLAVAENQMAQVCDWTITSCDRGMTSIQALSNVPTADLSSLLKAFSLASNLFQRVVALCAFL